MERAKLVNKQDIYKNLSKGGTVVIVEYPYTDDKEFAAMIYDKLALSMKVEFDRNSAIAYLNFNEFLIVQFTSLDAASSYVNSFGNEADRELYRAYLYVDGECIHENV